MPQYGIRYVKDDSVMDLDNSLCSTCIVIGPSQVIMSTVIQ